MRTLLVSLMLIIFVTIVYQGVLWGQNGTKANIQRDAIRVQQQIQGIDQ